MAPLLGRAQQASSDKEVRGAKTYLYNRYDHSEAVRLYLTRLQLEGDDLPDVEGEGGFPQPHAYKRTQAGCFIFSALVSVVGFKWSGVGGL